MSKIELNNRDHLRDLRLSLEEAIGKATASGGISFTLGKMSFAADGTNCRLSLEFNAGSNADAEKREFEKAAFLYDLKPSDYLREFVHGGKTYKVYGFKTRAAKSPILARNEQGVAYKFPEALIKSKFALKKAA